MNGEFLVISLEECGSLFVSAIPAGFVIGCIPMMIGFAVHALVKIFKTV